jgi:hypothetical protein
MSKALEILKKSQSVDERATSFITSIQRNLQRTVIDSLTEKKDRLTDEIFVLSDFSLHTDKNAGQLGLTRDEAEERFSQIINREYELVLVSAELKAKQDIFNKLFSDDQGTL